MIRADCSDRLDDVTTEGWPGGIIQIVCNGRRWSRPLQRRAGVKQEAWRTLELLPDVTSEDSPMLVMIDQDSWDVSTAPLVLSRMRLP